jgi:hypothetical protein
MSDMDTPFSTHQFGVGTKVKHRSMPDVTFVVVKRLLVESSEHPNMYIIESVTDEGNLVRLELIPECSLRFTA